LANALKYATAFPVIILSAMQRNYQPGKYNLSETGLYRLWLLFLLLNSVYSFYWDVAKDWDLSLFSSKAERNNPDHPWGLRSNRYFHSNNMYYTAIGIDFVLRFTWSIKLSPHLDHLNEIEGGIFFLEILEVFRRWMWIFFRVETEWGRCHSLLFYIIRLIRLAVRNNRGPAPDDILLGDYNADKYGED